MCRSAGAGDVRPVARVQLLELYGGFGPADAARVIEAIGGRAPVGTPGYG